MPDIQDQSGQESWAERMAREATERAEKEDRERAIREYRAKEKFQF